MKRFILITFSLLVTLPGYAQTVTETSVWDDPMLRFYVVASFIFVVSILVLVALLYSWKALDILAENAARERAEKLGIAYKPGPSLLKKFWDKINGFVPEEKEATLVMDHNYDGITELDNHLPPWWKLLFYGSIVWGFGYLLAYHVFNSFPLSISEYESEVAYAEAKLQQNKTNAGPQITEENVTVATDATQLENGKTTFLNTCASCHRRDGGGDIGPNLTDEYWKHGGSIKNLFHVVTNGVPGTNMVAWGSAMSPEAIRNVASYVLTLQGSNPVNGKKPEGDLYKPEVTAKSDSVNVK